jgi:hypothetical protein
LNKRESWAINGQKIEECKFNLGIFYFEEEEADEFLSF